MDESIIYVDVFIIPMCLEIIPFSFLSLVIQRNVDLCSFTLADPTIIIISAFSAGIETSVIVSMYGYKKHIRVLIEDMLSPISSVDVIIKYGYLFDRVLLLEVSGSDGNVVEDAKTIDFIVPT